MAGGRCKLSHLSYRFIIPKKIQSAILPLWGKGPLRSTASARVRFRTMELIPTGSSRVQWARWGLKFLCGMLVDNIFNKNFGKLRSSVQPGESFWGGADRFKKTKSGLCELVRLSFGLWAVQINSPQLQVYKTIKNLGYHCTPLWQEALTILILSTSSFQDHRVYPCRQLTSAMGSLGA